MTGKKKGAAALKAGMRRLFQPVGTLLFYGSIFPINFHLTVNNVDRYLMKLTFPK